MTPSTRRLAVGERAPRPCGTCSVNHLKPAAPPRRHGDRNYVGQLVSARTQEQCGYFRAPQNRGLFRAGQPCCGLGEPVRARNEASDRDDILHKASKLTMDWPATRRRSGWATFIRFTISFRRRRRGRPEVRGVGSAVRPGRPVRAEATHAQGRGHLCHVLGAAGARAHRRRRELGQRAVARA